MQNPIRKLVYTSERKFRNNFICKNSKSSMRKAKFSVQDDPYDVLSLTLFCPIGRFSVERFVQKGILSRWMFCTVECFVHGMLCPWDVIRSFVRRPFFLCT